MNLQIPIPLRLESHLLTASLPPDYQIDKDTTTGAEVVYKRAKGTATGSGGFSKRFSAACTGKAVVTSPLPLNGAAAAPVLTLQTTGDVFANTTGSASVQVDTAAKYKYGFQFATKI